MPHRDIQPINRNFKMPILNPSNNAMYVKARFAHIKSINVTIVYIPLTKCRDTLPYMIEKYFAKPYLLSFGAFVFTEQNIKARLNRYIIILEGSVQYFVFHSQQRKNTQLFYNFVVWILFCNTVCTKYCTFL